MADRGWYGKKGGDKSDKDRSEPKMESMHERHARERGEAHGRHAKAREDLNKQHEAELGAMAERQNNEVQASDQAGVEAGQGTPGGTAAPGAMVNAGAGAAAGTPPGVAGANAA